MKILSQEAKKTAIRFTKSCGRVTVTGNDMYYALMFEAHEFFDKDIDQRFFYELEREREHTYDTEESDDESEEEETESECEEMYTIEAKSDEEFHALVLKYATEWRTWMPNDPVKQMIKDAIDKTSLAQNES